MAELRANDPRMNGSGSGPSSSGFSSPKQSKFGSYNQNSYLKRLNVTGEGDMDLKIK